MIYSMTGYATRTSDVEGGALHIELKSVNSRYLDFQFRIGEELRSLEPALREMFGARLGRGKLECRLGFVAASTRAQATALNAELLAQLKDFDIRVRQEMPQAAPLSVSDARMIVAAASVNGKVAIMQPPGRSTRLNSRNASR